MTLIEQTLIEQLENENFENQAGYLNNFQPWHDLKAEHEQILKAALHMHVNSGVKGDDRCKQCGLDLRHIVHRRL